MLFISFLIYSPHDNPINTRLPSTIRIKLIYNNERTKLCLEGLETLFTLMQVLWNPFILWITNEVTILTPNSVLENENLNK